METFCDPRDEWIKQAQRFIRKCHERLLTTPEALWQLYEKGFTHGIIQDFQLGLDSQHAIVVPYVDSQSAIPQKITIYPENGEPFLFAGSRLVPAIFGSPGKPILIVESDLDAILFYQCAGDIICPIALGRAQMHSCNAELLTTTPLVLCASKNDEIGRFLQKIYPKILILSPPVLSGDVFKMGSELRKWVFLNLP